MSEPIIRQPDENAPPIDYSFVHSMHEGKEILHSQQIHGRDPLTTPGLKRRSERNGRTPETFPGYKPETDFGIPENPFVIQNDSANGKTPEPEEAGRQLQQRRRSRISEENDFIIQQDRIPNRYSASELNSFQSISHPDRHAEPSQTPVQETAVSKKTAPRPNTIPVGADESRFATPGTPEIPDWLKTAQMNNFTPIERLGNSPRVQAAQRPVQSSQAENVYAQAGYPDELLHRQQLMEQKQAMQPVRKRHGAEFAVNPYAAQPRNRFIPAEMITYGANYTDTVSNAGAVSNGMPEASVIFAPMMMPAEQFSAAEAATHPVQETPSQTVPRFSTEQPIPRANDSRAARVRNAVSEMPRERAAKPKRSIWKEREEPVRKKTSGKCIAAGLAALAALAAAAGVFVMKHSYQQKMQNIYAQRAAIHENLVKTHPLPIENLIRSKSEKYNLNPAFVAAIMLNESSFQTNATSSIDARGLMQLMDDTARWIHGKIGSGTAYAFDSMYNAETNAEFGCWYLNYLSNQFHGDPVLVAAAFHAGQGEVTNWLTDSRYSSDGYSISLDAMMDGPTKRYATRVLNDFAVYRRLYFDTMEESI